MLTRLQFTLPQRAPVLLFYDEETDLLRATALRGMDFAIFDPSPQKIALSVWLLPSALWLSLRLWLAPGPQQTTGCLSLKQAVLRGCILAHLRFLKPRVVLTFIHNSPIYWWVSRRLPGVKFIQISNALGVARGMTTDVVDPSNPAGLISTPLAICFGQRSIDLYCDHGHVIDTMVAAGSLRADYYRLIVAPSRPPQPDFDICLVSQWSWRHIKEGDAPFQEIRDTLLVLDEFLIRYLGERKLRACIAPRSEDEVELDYLREKYAGLATVVPRAGDPFSGYKLVDQSAVAVTFCSSIAFEAYSWGKKILACNLLNLESYYIPVHELCELRQRDYGVFRDKLDRLLAISAPEFSALTRENARFLVAQNPDLPVYELVRREIEAGLQQ